MSNPDTTTENFETDAALIDFAMQVLNVLESDDDWSSDTLEEIANAAHDLDLAISDDAGEFRVRPGVLPQVEEVPDERDDDGENRLRLMEQGL